MELRERGVLVMLLIIGLYSCGQRVQPKLEKVTCDDAKVIDMTDTIQLAKDDIKTIPFSQESYIHTEIDYTDSVGRGIIIQNSYPRGGGSIPNPSELNYGHAVFWTRIVNQLDEPLDLNISFPADSFTIAKLPHAHFKLLIPPDRMTLDKVTEFSFGLKNIQDFIDGNFYQPSQLQKTIYPKEDCIFYVILLSHLATTDGGVSRTGLFLKDKDLFYKLNFGPEGEKLLPCGTL